MSEREKKRERMRETENERERERENERERERERERCRDENCVDSSLARLLTPSSPPSASLSWSTTPLSPCASFS